MFDLPSRLRRKADPALIDRDERQFAAIARVLAAEVERTQTRLVALRQEAVSGGQRALERDLGVRSLSARLRILRRFGLDACIGRMVDEEGTVTYIGRFGLADAAEERLLMDWRAPASAPFFAATAAHPLGLTSRRRYRWREGRVVDYWDEAFADDGIDHRAALDDQSAFIASLGESRSPKMRDVLATIQSDQDAIIRADSRGALVVDGGPGTGKTVVALHRAAYLLYADPRVHSGGGGLLFVGPHRPYVDYVDDVLPGLGEDGALVCAVNDLVAGGGEAGEEADPQIRRLLGDGRMVDAVAAAVRLWQRPPRRRTPIETAWGTVVVGPAEWAEVFADAEAVAHNALRARAWDCLLDLLEDRIDDELRGGDGVAGGRDDGGDESWGEGWGEASRPSSRSGDDFDAYGSGWDEDESTRETLENDDELRALFDRAWPLLDPDALLRGLLTTGEMLRHCAPWLSAVEVDVLITRGAPTRWTDVDLPLLDAARRSVGDPRSEVRARRERRAAAEEHRVMSDVVSDLIAADDGDLRLMSMLRGQDLRRTLAQPTASDRDTFAGPFAHLVIDEAQELTDAQWRMLLQRCPSRSLTIVGDRAQARRGFAESWDDRLARVGIDRSHVTTLTVNYRTPSEVMDVAGPVIRAALPDANVPASIRSTGVPVSYGSRRDLDAIVDTWERESADGTAVVIGAPAFVPRPRVASLDAQRVKGLEFDLVVLVDPDRFGDGVTGAVDRYVAMTRATQRLVVLS
ncbi:AAA family ATPase [Microbacterium hominis]|uniref:HelD family protein n=1 Tax=Microbacterium hominis TaxID=162426 RepID=UPI002F3F9F8E